MDTVPIIDCRHLHWEHVPTIAGYKCSACMEKINIMHEIDIAISKDFRLFKIEKQFGTEFLVDAIVRSRTHS